MFFWMPLVTCGTGECFCWMPLVAFWDWECFFLYALGCFWDWGMFFCMPWVVFGRGCSLRRFVFGRRVMPKGIFLDGGNAFLIPHGLVRVM